MSTASADLVDPEKATGSDHLLIESAALMLGVARGLKAHGLDLATAESATDG